MPVPLGVAGVGAVRGTAAWARLHEPPQQRRSAVGTGASTHENLAADASALRTALDVGAAALLVLGRAVGASNGSATAADQQHDE